MLRRKPLTLSSSIKINYVLKLKNSSHWTGWKRKKTILNMMMEMHNRSAKFYVKQFAESMEDLDKTVNSLQRLISEEACRGSTLQSVVRTNNEDSGSLRLKLVFMLNVSKDEERVCEYLCDLKKMAHVERALKVNKKKHPLPNSNRCTNITCQTDWLDLFQDDAKIVEVISVADNAPKSKSGTKKIKKRSFDVRNIWIYEKPLKKCNFDGLVRQVWTPFDKTLHENIKKEVWHFGDFGWVLATILVTPHIRMKGDGSDHCKCILFFQRKSSVHGNLDVVMNKEQDLIENGDQLTETNGKAVSSPPKDKTKGFGLGMISQDDLTHTKLRHTPQANESNVHESANKQVTVNLLSGVQLKKVDREKLKSEQASQDSQNQTVPWHNSLQRKREAVQRNELKKGSTDDSLPKPTHAEQEIVLKLEEIKNKNTHETDEVSPDIPFIDKDGSQDPLRSPPARDPVSEPVQSEVVETTPVSELAPLALPVKIEDIPFEETSELQNEVQEDTISNNNKPEVISDTNEDNVKIEVEKEKDEVNEKDEGVESKDDFNDYRIESRVPPSCLQQNLSQDEGIETCDSSKDMRSPDEETSVDFTKEDPVEEVTEKAKEIAESRKVEKPTEDVVPTEKSTSVIATQKNDKAAEDDKEPSDNKTSAAEATAIKVITELLPIDMSATQSDVKYDAAPQTEQVSAVEATDISTTTEIKEISTTSEVVKTPKVQLEVTKEEHTAATEPSPECKDQLNTSDSTKVVDLNATSEKEISKDETTTQVLNTVESEDQNVSQTDKLSESEHVDVEPSELANNDKNENYNNNLVTLQHTPDTSILAASECVVDEYNVKSTEVSEVNESTEEETKLSKHEKTTSVEDMVGKLPQPESEAAINHTSSKFVTENTPADVEVVESECINTTKEETDSIKDTKPVSEVVAEILDDVSAECIRESDQQSRSETSDAVDNTLNENYVSTTLQSVTEKVLMETKDTSNANILESTVAETPKEQLEVTKEDDTAPTVSETAAEIITDPSQKCKDQLNTSDSTKVVAIDATESVNENAAQPEEITTSVGTSLKEASNESEAVEPKVNHEVQTELPKEETAAVTVTETVNTPKSEQVAASGEIASVPEFSKVEVLESEPKETPEVQAEMPKDHPKSEETTASETTSVPESSKIEVVESEPKETPEVQAEIPKDETSPVTVSESVNTSKPEETTASGEIASVPEISKVEVVESEPKETPEVQAEMAKDEISLVTVSESVNISKPEETTASGEIASVPEFSKVEVLKSEPKETPEVQAEIQKDETSPVTVSESVNISKTEEATASGETASVPESSKVEVVEFEPKETHEVVVVATKPSLDAASEPPKLDAPEVVDNVSTTPVINTISADICVVDPSETKEFSNTEVIGLENENISQEQAELEKEETPISVSGVVAEVVKAPPQESEAESTDRACSKPDDNVVATTKTSEPLQDGKSLEELWEKRAESDVVDKSASKQEDVTADISIKEVSGTAQLQDSSDAEIVKSEPGKTEASTSVPDAIAEIVSAAYLQSKDELANPASVQTEVQFRESEKSECIKSLEETEEPSTTLIAEPATKVIKEPSPKADNQLSSSDILVSEAANSMSNEVVNGESAGTSPAENISLLNKSETQESSNSEIVKSGCEETSQEQAELPNNGITSPSGVLAEEVSEAETPTYPAIKDICDTGLEISTCTEDAKGEMEPRKTETTTDVSKFPAQDITGQSETTINLLSTSESTEVAAGKPVTEFVDEDAANPEELIAYGETSLKEASSVPEITKFVDTELVKSEPSKNDESPISVPDVVAEAVKETPRDSKGKSENQESEEPETKETSGTEPTEKSECTLTLEVQADSSKDKTTTLISGSAVETSTELSAGSTVEPTESKPVEVVNDDSTTFAAATATIDNVALENEDSYQEKTNLSKDEIPTSVSSLIADVVSEASQAEDKSVKPTPVESHIKATTVAEVEKSERNRALKENELPSKDDAAAKVSPESSSDITVDAPQSESNKLSEEVVTQMMAMSAPVKEDTQLENLCAAVEDSCNEEAITEISSKTCDAKLATLESNENVEELKEQPRDETISTVSAEVTKPSQTCKDELTASESTQVTDTVNVNNVVAASVSENATNPEEIVAVSDASETKQTSNEISQIECNQAPQEQPNTTKVTTPNPISNVVAESLVDITSSEPPKSELSAEVKDNVSPVSEITPIVNNTSETKKSSGTENVEPECKQVQTDLIKDDLQTSVTEVVAEVLDNVSAEPPQNATSDEQPMSETADVVDNTSNENDVSTPLQSDTEKANTDSPDQVLMETKNASNTESEYVEELKEQLPETTTVSKTAAEIITEPSQKCKDPLNTSDSTKVVAIDATESVNENAAQPEEITTSVGTSLKEASNESEAVEPKETPEVHTELPKDETVPVTITESVNASKPEETTASGETASVPESSKIEVIESEPKETPEVQAELPKDETALVTVTESVNASKPEETTAYGEISLNETKHLQDNASTLSITPSDEHIQQLNVDDLMSAAPSTSHDADSNIAAAAIDNEEVLITESIPCDVNDEKKIVETEKAHICDDNDNHNESYASPTPLVASESSSVVVTTEQQSAVFCSTQGENISAVENDKTQLKNEKAVNLVSDINNESLSSANDEDVAAASSDKGAVDDQTVKSGKTEEDYDLLGENVIRDGNTQPTLPSACSASENCTAPQQENDKTIESASVLTSSVGHGPQNEPQKPSAQVKETNEVKSSLLQEANAGDTVTEPTPVSQEPQQIFAKAQKETSVEKDVTSANSSPPESCSTTGGDKHI